MRWLYNILFSIALGLAAPGLLLKLRRRGAWREAFGQRFGRYRPGALPPVTPGKTRLWLHAVSVGEVNTCLQLIHCLQTCRPDIQLIVSTTTNTGMAELKRKLADGVTPIYFPIDGRRFIRRALAAVQPDAVILVEREIWPNFLWRLNDLSIPVFLVNARISARSHKAYRRYSFLFRPLYAQLAAVAAQTQQDATRLHDVGCSQDRLHVCGNMKFDAAGAHPPSPLDVPDLLRRAGHKPDAPVLVAGSTHDGEELLLAQLASQLRREFPDLFLVIVPRHFERCQEIATQFDGAGIPFSLRSRLRESQLEAPPTKTLLVDSTGELTAFYAAADLVFIGKSLCARGGQNPIEPATLGKPIIVGPNMQNFAGVTQQLLDGDGAVRIRDAAQLESAVAALLRSAERCSALGANARDVIRRNMGATARTTDLLLAALPNRADSPPG